MLISPITNGNSRFISLDVVKPGSSKKGKRFKNSTLDGVSVAKTDILVIMDSGEKRGQKAKSESTTMDNKMQANMLQRSQEAH